MKRVRWTIAVLLVALGLTAFAGCCGPCGVGYWWEPCGRPDCAPCGDPCDPCDSRR